MIYLGELLKHDIKKEKPHISEGEGMKVKSSKSVVS